MSIKKLADSLKETKFRIVSQGDLLILKAIRDAEEPSASSIMLATTVATSRMMTLSQIGPILKDLLKLGAISSKDSKSEATGRPMLLYSLTSKGNKLLDLGSELVTIAAK